MPILYPASLDSLTNPTSSDTLAGVPHAAQHSDENDAIEALETKVGVGASTPSTPGHVLRVTAPGATAYGAIQDGDLPATIARDSEITSAVSAHDADTTAVHGIADTALLLTTSHEAAADPHSGYQKESEKAAAGGYASLDASSKVPVAQIRSLNAGTSFPGSPATNDMFFRTDRGIGYYYDGTRWLSLQLFTLSAQHLSNNPTSGAVWNQWPLPTSTDVYLVDMVTTTRVLTTNDGSNFWSVRTVKVGTTGGTATQVGTSIVTSADVAGDYVPHTHALGAVVSTATHFWLWGDAIKTGAPGNIYVFGAIRYRLVG